MLQLWASTMHTSDPFLDDTSSACTSPLDTLCPSRQRWVTRQQPAQVKNRPLCAALRHAVWAGGVLGSVVALLVPWSAPADAFGFAPIYIQLSVNRVWGSPTVDLPPQRQRPDLYAELSMLGQQVLTPVEPTPRINEDVYPEWRMSAASERAWLEEGHPITISIRIFDEDEGDDDKVLFSSLLLDPYTCEVTVGEQSIAGAWINSRTTCVVSIPDLRSETGSVALTISTQWLGASPGR